MSIQNMVKELSQNIKPIINNAKCIFCSKSLHKDNRNNSQEQSYDAEGFNGCAKTSLYGYYVEEARY